MKNLAKILVLALLVASVMAFAACGNNDDDPEDNTTLINVENYTSFAAVVADEQAFENVRTVLSPVGDNDVIEDDFWVSNADSRIYFAGDEDDRYNVTAASHEDLTPGTNVTVYIAEVELVKDSEPVGLADAIIVIEQD